jgi:Tol biopolymer transport system component
LTWFDRTGRVLATVGEPASYGDLALSPDGKRAVVLRQDPGQADSGVDLWMLDLDRAGLASRFTFEMGADYAPVWSRDGANVFFSSDRKGDGDFYQKTSSGAGTEQLVFADSANKRLQDLSPDGRFAAFTASDAGNIDDLWIVPLFGDKKPFPFLQTRDRDYGARFSPDGRWIAYASNESGPLEVYVTAFDGSGPASGAKRQVSAGGGSDPVWRRDGREIFYVSNPPDRVLMAAAVRAEGSNFDVGKVELLFEIRPGGAGPGFYQVSADGQRFLVNQAPEQGEPQPITIVINWTAGAKR